MLEKKGLVFTVIASQEKQPKPDLSRGAVASYQESTMLGEGLAMCGVESTNTKWEFIWEGKNGRGSTGKNL